MMQDSEIIRQAFNDGSAMAWNAFPLVALPLCSYQNSDARESFREGYRAGLAWRVAHAEEGWHAEPEDT